MGEDLWRHSTKRYDFVATAATIPSRSDSIIEYFEVKREKVVATREQSSTVRYVVTCIAQRAVDELRFEFERSERQPEGPKKALQGRVSKVGFSLDNIVPLAASAT